MAKLWVTGADGFVGGWLVREAQSAGHEVVSWCGPPHAQVNTAPGSHTLDLARLEEASALQALPWDAVAPPHALIHLAAISSPPVCEEHPELAQAVNVDGPRAFYQEMWRRWPQCRVLHVSSGHVYRPQATPLSEDQTLEPINVYGRTKLDGEAMALAFAEHGHRVTVVRPFNHTGPGQAPLFALPSFALRLALLERDGGGSLGVGRLDAVRDFLHVREVVRAYLDLLPKLGEEPLLNVCSGVGTPIQDFLDAMIAQVAVTIEVEQEQDRLRGSADADCLVGDPARLHQVIGRTPELDRDALVGDLLEDARARLARGEDASRA